MPGGLAQTSIAPLSSKAPLLLALIIVFTSRTQAQKSSAVAELRPLQPGITLPVRLSHALEAGNARPGARIVAITTQRVPVGPHAYLHHGARLFGEVVASTEGDGTAAHPSTLSLRFTSLHYKGQVVPIATSAVAIANFVQVDDTTVPINGGSDRGNNSPASWTTSQIGGDILARSGWIADLVDGDLHKVGSADYFGVYTLPQPPKNGSGPPFPRALGVFSATASGLYGIEEGTTLHSSGGIISLTRPARKLLLRDGDNLLLEVISAEPPVPRGHPRGAPY